jgi:hypothetical protein
LPMGCNPRARIWSLKVLLLLSHRSLFRRDFAVDVRPTINDPVIILNRKRSTLLVDRSLRIIAAGFADVSARQNVVRCCTRISPPSSIRTRLSALNAYGEKCWTCHSSGSPCFSYHRCSDLAEPPQQGTWNTPSRPARTSASG